MVQLRSQESWRGHEVLRSGAIGLLVWASSAARSSLSLGRPMDGMVHGPPLLGLMRSFPPTAGTVEPRQLPVTGVPSCPACCAQPKRAYLPKVPPHFSG